MLKFLQGYYCTSLARVLIAGGTRGPLQGVDRAGYLRIFPPARTAWGVTFYL